MLLNQVSALLTKSLTMSIQPKLMWLKHFKSFQQRQELMMLMDYSTILIQIESKTKMLSNRCLEKRFEGFSSEIASLHFDLTLLAMWIVQEQQRVSDNKRSQK